MFKPAAVFCICFIPTKGDILSLLALHLFSNIAMLKQLEAVYCCLLSWLVASSVLAVPWQVSLAPVGVEKAGLQLPSAASVSPLHMLT